MAVDTVKLRSPVIDEGTASFLEGQCILKQGVQLSTGEILYEITTGDLEGSFDSRIMFKVMREDWVYEHGHLDKVPCDPYVIVECSWHKFFYGQNVFGNPTHFQGLAEVFIDKLGEIMGGDSGMFHRAGKWQVCRVDWAEMFRMTPYQQDRFFRSLRHIRFPRREKKEAKYASAVHFPGSHTTLRIYSKGPEFKEHGLSVLRRGLVKRHLMLAGQDNQMPDNSIVIPKNVASHPEFSYIERLLAAIQRLANCRLRVEIQINAEKLRYDFGGLPLVSEITDEYLINIYEEQIFKFLKEGKSEMQTVRTHDAVKSRLNAVYGNRSANILFAFWMQLSVMGDSVVREDYSKSQFYSNRKKLVDAGVSWRQTDIFVAPQDDSALPDFFPVLSDPRRCFAPVSEKSIFRVFPVEQHRFFNQAA